MEVLYSLLPSKEITCASLLRELHTPPTQHVSNICFFGDYVTKSGAGFLDCAGGKFKA